MIVEKAWQKSEYHVPCTHTETRAAEHKKQEAQNTRYWELQIRLDFLSILFSTPVKQYKQAI